MSDPEKHVGGCLCGAVRFELVGAFHTFMLCHCSRCRKTSGTAHASNLFGSQMALRWISGESELSSYNHPGTRFGRVFCRICSSQLPRERSGLVMVPAGCLETPVSVRPSGHIFCASRAQWDVALDDAPHWDALPEA